VEWHRNNGGINADGTLIAVAKRREVNMDSKQLIVIGGGAAGFFCAVNAARLNPGLKIIVIEKTNKLLSKVKVSGGGRCNVTHACFDIAEMSRQYPRGNNFVKKAFHQFFTTDTIHWFEERGVKLKTEADGRMFPVSDSSQTIIDCLMREANRYGVEIMMKAEVESLKYNSNKFRLELAGGRYLDADLICIACGGYSKTEMFDWLRQTGHSIERPVPSLFTFNMPGHPIRELMGVAVEKVNIKIAGTSLVQEGPLLITHWGLSGPAVLRLSAWGAKELAEKNYEFTIYINWLAEAGYNESKLRETFIDLRGSSSSRKIVSTNFSKLPQRLWLFLLVQSGISGDMRFGDLPKKMENLLIRNLANYEMHVKGKTTFKEEFVTAGGIRLPEIDPNTMMSKKLTNLYFAGEILDVDGITGGFNFQHAWTSGFIAGKNIAAS
jgi:predicted Rossmann fold flavoprotein